jgi:outer membrane protein assembly factor BamB
MSFRMAPAVAVLTLSAGLLLARADDWPQFRGPNGKAVADGTGLPAEWARDKNVLWKVEVPGVAWSCPVVSGDKVFVTTAVADRQQKPRAGGGFGPGGGGFGPGGGGRGGFGPGGGMRGGRAPNVKYSFEVHCLDRTTGKTLWKATAVEQRPTIPTQASNTYATETPVTDGERVYAYFGMTGVFCFDLEGKPVWKKDLGSYSMQNGWGTGSSPVLDGDRLFVQCDNEEKSFLIALDKKTGKELWKKSRSDRSSWTTPLVWKNKVRTEIVCVGTRGVRSYDPATGDTLWELSLGGRGNASASPVGDEERVYVGNGGPFGSAPLYAVKAGAKGDVTPKGGENGEFIAWSNSRAAPTMASPLLYQGQLYIFDQRAGTVTCVDAKTGKQQYRERLPRARGITSSPWAYDDKVFCTDEEGHTFVLKAGTEFKVLGTNRIDEMVWSSPAVAKDTLLLRGVDHLYCIKGK